MRIGEEVWGEGEWLGCDCMRDGEEVEKCKGIEMGEEESESESELKVKNMLFMGWDDGNVVLLKVVDWGKKMGEKSVCGIGRTGEVVAMILDLKWKGKWDL